MKLTPISINLYITDNDGFKNYKKEYVHELLKSVDINFSNALQIPPFSTKPCFINYTKGNPKCVKVEDQAHIILISAFNDYLPRWVYEFSHEYCHHLIDGPMQTEIMGLIWFEETICELSSMYHLHKSYIDWHNSTDMNKWLNFHSFQEYLHDLLTKNPKLVDSTHHQGWLSSWLQILSEPKHHRDHYNAIAVRILPLFVENPFLWKIILHFGDSRKWNSLHDLFDHLFDLADDSYSDSLSKLHELLFY